MTVLQRWRRTPSGKLAMGKPVIAGRPITILEQGEDGYRVSVWSPPSGVWQQFLAPMHFATQEEAAQNCTATVLQFGAAVVLSHSDFPPEVRDEVLAKAALRLAAQEASEPTEFVRIQPLRNGARLEIIHQNRPDEPPQRVISERLPSLDQARILGLKLAERCGLPLLEEPAP